MPSEHHLIVRNKVRRSRIKSIGSPGDGYTLKMGDRSQFLKLVLTVLPSLLFPLWRIGRERRACQACGHCAGPAMQLSPGAHPRIEGSKEREVYVARSCLSPTKGRADSSLGSPHRRPRRSGDESSNVESTNLDEQCTLASDYSVHEAHEHCSTVRRPRIRGQRIVASSSIY